MPAAWFGAPGSSRPTKPGGAVSVRRADDIRPYHLPHFVGVVIRPFQKFHKIFIVNRPSGMVQWSPR